MTSKQDQNKDARWNVDTRKKLWVCLACGLVAASMWWLPGVSVLLEHLEVKTRDILMGTDKRLEPREDLVFLGIDARSLQVGGVSDEEVEESETLQRMRGQYPWDRRVYAAAIDKLAGAGAKVIVLDIVFAQNSGAEQDQVLADAIARHRDKIVLTSAFAPMATQQGNDGMQVIEPIEALLGPLDDETAFGYANFWSLEDDGVIRKAHFHRTLNEANGHARHPDEHVYESIAAVAARKMGGVVPDEPRRFRMGVKGGGDTRNSYEPLSLVSIFSDKEWEANYGDGEFFKDKLVMIGPASPLFHDEPQTAVGKVYGPQLHLHVIAAILDGAWYDEIIPRRGVPLVSLCLVGIILGVLCAYYSNKALSLSVCWLVYIIVMSLLMVAGVQWMSRLFGGWGVGFVFSFELLGMIVWQAMRERAQRIQLHGHLQRSMSPDVADAIVKAPEGYYRAAAGNRRQVTVLFADVRGFTHRSESQDAGELVSQLNEYLGRMVEVIFAHGGTVDKFIGDAIMATWGGLDDSDTAQQNESSVGAANDMLTALSELNASWQEGGKESFRIGIGIHHGEAIVGEVGSDQRTDFTVIGDAVNLASRIEGLTKMLGVDLLISGEVAGMLANDDCWVEVAKVRVKGRDGGVALSMPASTVPDENDAMRVFVQLYVSGDWQGAKKRLGDLLGSAHFAGVARFYDDVLQHTDSPDEGWDGLITMQTK